MSNVSKVFNRDVRLTGGAALYVNEVKVIDESWNIDAPVTTTNLTTTWTTTLWDAVGDTVTINGNAQANGTITVGVNDTGKDVKFFGATAWAYMLWDESEDDLVLAWAGGLSVAGASTFTGTVTVWVDGTGKDVKLYSDTASNYRLRDESDDKVVQAFVSGSTSTVEPHTITSTLSGVGVTGGRFKHALTINAAAGSYTNAIKGDVTYGASGRTDGLGSSVLAEMTLSAGTTSGTYAPLEIELNCGSNAPIGTNTALAYMSVNGTATNFIDSGHVLNLQGLGAATSGKVFQANTAGAATHALKILIGTTPYYIMLTDQGA